MKILYHTPFRNIIYAGRTIYHGYKNAFLDMGHTFLEFYNGENIGNILDNNKIDIFITSSNYLSQKGIDRDALNKHRKNGLKVFVNTDFWDSPLWKSRINEAPSLSQNSEYINLIKNGKFGDVFYNTCEPGDPRMDGFTKTTGYPLHTIPLACDASIIRPIYDKKFESDISFIGTNLPQKRNYFREWVFPLSNKYNLSLYGQDWTLSDKLMGYVQKVGQYLEIPILSNIRKPKLHLNDESRIYRSSKISINIHESYQREYGGDCNERTFKIPAAGGFEITDDVACIRKYFKEGKEIIIAKNKDDRFDKIDYYINHPNERNTIIEAGRDRVLKDHTYHNRVKQILDIYNKNI